MDKDYEKKIFSDWKMIDPFWEENDDIDPSIDLYSYKKNMTKEEALKFLDKLIFQDKKSIVAQMEMDYLRITFYNYYLE